IAIFRKQTSVSRSSKVVIGNVLLFFDSVVNVGSYMSNFSESYLSDNQTLKKLILFLCFE
ncbi:hypothetical protein LCGC14_2058760, partial [marine sediment metagenome]